MLPDGTKLYLPEYEAAIAQALGRTELAVALREGRPLLILQGEGDEEEILRTLRPVLAERPRGQQLGGIRFVSEPLPRTATGKIKRWELQRYCER